MERLLGFNESCLIITKFQLQNNIDGMKKTDNVEITKMKAELELMKRNDETNVLLIDNLRNELTGKNNELRKLEIEQTKLLTASKRVKV